MRLDPERVLANARESTTEDLLDRVTVYRAGMEPEALAILEAELRDRGVTAAQIHMHSRSVGERCLRYSDGTALQCSFCRRPAIAIGWGWHRLWGRLPLFPRRFRYCADHQPHHEPEA